MRQGNLLLAVITGLVLVAAAPGTRTASAHSLADITDNRATIKFPDTVTFHIDITAADKITSLVLEYGDQEETCGAVVAKAFPEITPATHVQADWVWDMHQSGSLPPGSLVWWRWRYVDDRGQEYVSDQKNITWLDDQHAWKEISKGDIRLHWYGGTETAAGQLLQAADQGLHRVETDAGLANEAPIDLYIYASNSDMQEAILYEPGWTGGEAFPGQNIVIIGIPPDELSWGKTAEVHELTHVLVGHYTFSCLGSVPTWLNEGLAVYSEGQLDPASQAQLDEAIRTDSLLTVRSLSGPFSEVPGRAYLSYSESYSLVKYLIGNYGRDKMNALLLALRDGNTVDEALKAVYGFDVDGMEDGWRMSLGAQPRASSIQPTPATTPTYVPTISPVSGALPPVSPTPFSHPIAPAPVTQRSSPPAWLTLMLILTCCTLTLVVGGLVLGFIVSLQRRKGSVDENHS